MDARRDRLQKELEDLLARASAVAAELQAVEQGPHDAALRSDRVARAPAWATVQPDDPVGAGAGSCGVWPGGRSLSGLRADVSRADEHARGPLDGWAAGDRGNIGRMPALSPVFFSLSVSRWDSTRVNRRRGSSDRWW